MDFVFVANVNSLYILTYQACSQYYDCGPLDFDTVVDINISQKCVASIFRDDRRIACCKEDHSGLESW
jgi:hypothetical protein